MWRLESDPQLSSTFANVALLDKPADLDRFRRRMERASIVVPRLRQKVQESHVSGARWIDDPDFDINNHVRHVRLEAPRTLRHLYDYAVAVAATPFDRTKPLWEFIVVDGLPKGRGAIIQKIHHTITDGEGAVQLSLQFLDLERNAPDPTPLAAPVIESASTPAQMVLAELVQRALKVPKQAAEILKEFSDDPNRLGELGVTAFDTARGIVKQLGDTEKAHSPLWTSRSMDRQLEVLRVPFVDAKATSKALGGTINTFFVSAAADASGRYHRAHGAPVDELRASMAISVRKSNDDANAFTLARLPAPTGEMSPAERFKLIQQRTETAKGESAAASLDTLAKVAGPLPTPMLVQMARKQGSTVDFATSNVKAAPFPVYIAGGLLQENYPVGPALGAAFNLTLLSYAGSMDMGLNCDTAAIADPAALRKDLEASFRDLIKAAQPAK
jgi:diacylglycerol O-acyltransferase / wax synthase